jgi:hypothetical protein
MLWKINLIFNIILKIDCLAKCATCETSSDNCLTCPATNRINNPSLQCPCPDGYLDLSS